MVFRTIMDNISFKSRIILTSPSGYKRAAMRIPAKNFINYPWTPAQGVLAESVATSDVFDCEFVGITNGQKILGGHFDPLNKINQAFSNIKNFLDKNIKEMGDKANLQAVIIGGKAPCIAGEDSYKQIKKTQEYLESEKIPYSIFAGGMGKRDICYSSQKDEFIIGADIVNDFDPYKKMSAEEAFKKVFNIVKVSENDEIIFQKTWF